MLEFPENYFEEEVREGFTVSGLMKRAWAAQLEILQRIIDICSRHGLTYYAYWGTLLGTIRHQGFVPWDDDVDIALMREDYMRLLEAAKTELPAGYCILSCYTEEEWDNSFMRITNGSTIDASDERLTQYHGFPFVAGIDIYPLDYLPRDPQAAELQKTLLEAVGDVASILEFVEERRAAGESAGNLEAAGDSGGNPEAAGESAESPEPALSPAEELAEAEQSLEEGLSVLEECFGTVIDRKRNMNAQLQRLYDQVCMMYGEKDSDMITNFPNHIKRQNGYCVEKRWLAETLQMPFENIMISVPRGYDEILTLSYRNYMVPRNVRVGEHDYPFYKEQQLMLLEEGLQAGVPDDGGNPGEKDGGQRKKIILYHVDYEQFMRQPSLVNTKIRYVLRIFQDNADVRIWWSPFVFNQTGDTFARKCFPQEYEEYRGLVEEYKSLAGDELKDIDSYEKAISMSAAYYGDRDSLLERYRETGKPIMVQNYSIT